MVASGKLAEAGRKGASAGGRANADVPGRMQAVGAMQSNEGKAMGGRVAGRLATESGRLAEVGKLGARKGGLANAADPGRMRELNAKQSAEAKALGGRNATKSRVRKSLLREQQGETQT